MAMESGQERTFLAEPTKPSLPAEKCSRRPMSKQVPRKNCGTKWSDSRQPLRGEKLGQTGRYYHQDRTSKTPSMIGRLH